MPINKVVDEIGQLSFEGNIIPASWFEHIKTPAGKTDSIGIILLSDIIYWYRPTIVRDEATNKVMEVRKKFGADKLQRSYSSYAECFGYTKRQVVDALKRLQDAKLITLELRTVKFGQVLVSNVLFIEPVVENIKLITSPRRDTYHEKRGRSHEKTGYKYRDNNNRQTRRLCFVGGCRSRWRLPRRRQLFF